RTVLRTRPGNGSSRVGMVFHHALLACTPAPPAMAAGELSLRRPRPRRPWPGRSLLPVPSWRAPTAIDRDGETPRIARAPRRGVFGRRAASARSGHAVGGEATPTGRSGSGRGCWTPRWVPQGLWSAGVAAGGLETVASPSHVTGPRTFPAWLNIRA